MNPYEKAWHDLNKMLQEENSNIKTVDEIIKYVKNKDLEIRYKYHIGWLNDFLNEYEKQEIPECPLKTEEEWDNFLKKFEDNLQNIAWRF